MAQPLSAYFLPLLFASLPAFAQYTTVASDDDGRTILIETPMRLAGSDVGRGQKILRWSPSAGLETVAADRLDFLPNILANATRPFLSGDARYEGYLRSPACLGGSACLFIHAWVFAPGLPFPGDVFGPVLPEFIMDAALVSRNGAWTIWVGNQSTSGFIRRAAVGSSAAAAVELVRAVRLRLADSQQSLTDSGAVLAITNDTRLMLADGATVRELAPQAARGVISALGNAIVFERTVAGAHEAVWLDPATGVQRILLTDPAALQLSISNDGSRALIVAAGNALLVDLLTGNSRSLGDVGGGARAAFLTGSGNAAVITRPDESLVRLDLLSGEEVSLIAGLPLLRPPTPSPTPGSLVRFAGNVPGDSHEFRVRILSPSGAADAPLLSAEPGELLAQVPWEQSLSQAGFAVSQAGRPLEYLSFNHFVTALQPAFWKTAGLPQVKASHQDFHGLLTQSDPARPGETVHVYLTGLGPTTPQLRTGETTPNSITPVVNRPACRLGGIPVDVPFAGLLPGYFGVYQMDVTIPSAWQAGTQLQCQIGTNADVAEVWIAP